MEILKINPKNFLKAQIVKIVGFLKTDRIIILPTDTCYGIMGKATNSEVVRKIYKIKGRAFKKPLSCIFRDLKMIKRFAKVDQQNEKLMQRLLPGPITFVLPKRSLVSKKKNLSRILTAGQKFIGVRIPKNKIIAAVMKKINFPITATSANLSGKKEPYSIGEILRQYKDQKSLPDLLVDAGRLAKIKPSTIVKSFENKKIKILRRGPISKREISKLL